MDAITTATISLDRAVECLLDSAASGLCRTFDGPSIADGDPFFIPDTGTEAGDVRAYCDAGDLVSVDVPTGVDQSAGDYDGSDPVRNIELGTVPGLYARLAATLDDEA